MLTKQSKMQFQVSQISSLNRGLLNSYKFTYKEQRDYETIEEDIAQLEGKIEELENSMSKFASDFVKLNQIVKEKEEAEALLEEKMDRWMYLEDLKAKIDAQ